MWKKDGIIFDGNSIIHDGRQIFNPSDETLKKAGFVWEEPNIPEMPDMSAVQAEFDAACVKFQEICQEIGALIGNPYFKGGFDEMAEFETSEAAATPDGIALSIKWMAADKLCTYLASKLGIGQPEWWYQCWYKGNDGILPL
ncbi:MAG: hypothetical protein IKA32_04785 [Lentisphaeria bacterium]|nr:hypothetical protein [Lentisphaeria bacterium]